MAGLACFLTLKDDDVENVHRTYTSGQVPIKFVLGLRRAASDGRTHRYGEQTTTLHSVAVDM